ncbi:hypothetical protein Tco_1044349 [Tanacetum coccineum]|uniref:Uncharacterized protein n=1 Tax=Tanacetum coccineum TaxID=301880 RepID=A0ABQ5GQQ2_9ASTR
MPKPPSPCNELLKESSPITPSNHALPQPYSPPLIDPYVDVIYQSLASKASLNIITTYLTLPKPILPYSTVRILQKSQENDQNRTNTDTGKEREYKSRKNAIKGFMEASTNLQGPEASPDGYK